MLALLLYANGVLTYAPLVKNLMVGDIIVNYDPEYLGFGNTLYLSQIPVGFYVNSIEDYPGSGSRLNKLQDLVHSYWLELDLWLL